MEEMNLEEMRNQIAILKNKLNKQELVSERLLADTMKTKVNTINSVERFSIICAIFCLVAYPVLRYYIGFSWPFVIATCVMMVFCIIATTYIHRPLHDSKLMTSDVASVARVMVRFKRQYDNWLLYVTPTLLIPWVLWASYEYNAIMGLEGVSPFLTVLPILAGCAIGGAIGYRQHRKAVKTAEEIIRQFEE